MSDAAADAAVEAAGGRQRCRTRSSNAAASDAESRTTKC
jgi:hypothetical protein